MHTTETKKLYHVKQKIVSCKICVDIDLAQKRDSLVIQQPHLFFSL